MSRSIKGKSASGARAPCADSYQFKSSGAGDAQAAAPGPAALATPMRYSTRSAISTAK